MSAAATGHATKCQQHADKQKLLMLRSDRVIFSTIPSMEVYSTEDPHPGITKALIACLGNFDSKVPVAICLVCSIR